MTRSSYKLFLIAIMWVAAVREGWAAGVADTKHNLATGGTGATSEICIFCHAPHNATPATPLWNRTLPTLVYTPYSSSTMQAAPGQPTHASKLCLSCHDGTIGLGQTLNPPMPAGTGGTITGRANLTTDLSDDHPVSFAYTSALAAQDTELVDPSLLTGSVRLDRYGELQCTTCHDPHYTPYPKFLVKDNTYSGLCTTCHRKQGWAGSNHSTSTATWNGAGLDPWPHTDWTTVATNGCENCHSPHKAGQPLRLLNYAKEEDNCLSCHNGNVDRKNLSAEFQKAYRHPIASYTSIHDPTENFSTMPRHVECQDCHNPHAANSTTATAPAVSGPLLNVAGITSAGTRTDNAQYQYEVCFRCHSDNPNVPAPTIRRQILQPNIRLKLQLTNPSMHPVMGQGRSTTVPSLISPWTTTSRVYCTDCHSNNAGPGANGTGPKGPHGSTWPFILEREYRTADNTTETAQVYAMCYKCHNRTSILNDQSFRYHHEHITGQNTPCSVCHDPHGISSTQGNATKNSHLINFDTTVVLPDPTTGRLEFNDLGTRTGRCYLRCHGESHSPKSY